MLSLTLRVPQLTLRVASAYSLAYAQFYLRATARAYSCVCATSYETRWKRYTTWEIWAGRGGAAPMTPTTSNIPALAPAQLVSTSNFTEHFKFLDAANGK